MNFVNNWQRPIELGAEDAVANIDLPDGDYRLTVTNSESGVAYFEILDAHVESQSASLYRGMEGTAARDWPAGSVIYCSLTADVLSDLFVLKSKFSSMQRDIYDLDDRISALEGGGGMSMISEQSSYYFGFSKDTQGSYGVFGSISPEFASAIPGADPVDGAAGEILQILWNTYDIRVLLRGSYSQPSELPFKKLKLGGKEFDFSNAQVYGGGGSAQTGIQLAVSENPLPPGKISVLFS